MNFPYDLRFSFVINNSLAETLYKSKGGIFCLKGGFLPFWCGRSSLISPIQRNAPYDSSLCVLHGTLILAAGPTKAASVPTLSCEFPTQALPPTQVTEGLPQMDRPAFPAICYATSCRTSCALSSRIEVHSPHRTQSEDKGARQNSCVPRFRCVRPAGP